MHWSQKTEVTEFDFVVAKNEVVESPDPGFCAEFRKNVIEKKEFLELVEEAEELKATAKQEGEEY